MKHTPSSRGVLVALLFVLLLPCLSGCALIMGNDVSGEPGKETRYDDAGIKTGIASALLKLDAARANDVSVHCFNGHVFLIGEADKEFRIKALDIARRAEGVVHVTTHWFPPGTASPALDAGIEAEVDRKRLFAESINARRVAVDVWGGHVVLTGVVSAQAEIDRAVAAIKADKQVKSVTSYIALSANLPESRAPARQERRTGTDKTEKAAKKEAPLPGSEKLEKGAGASARDSRKTPVTNRHSAVSSE